MLRSGMHAPYTEREARGLRVLGPGIFVGTIPAAFVESSWHAPHAALGIRITGTNSSNVRPGSKRTQVVPFDCILQGVRVHSNAVGSAIFDIKRTTIADFPAEAADTLCPLEVGRPKLANSQFYEDRVLFGWTTRVLAKGELLTYEIIEISGIGSVTLTLLVSPNYQP